MYSVGSVFVNHACIFTSVVAFSLFFFFFSFDLTTAPYRLSSFFNARKVYHCSERSVDNLPVLSVRRLSSSWCPRGDTFFSSLFTGILPKASANVVTRCLPIACCTERRARLVYASVPFRLRPISFLGGVLCPITCVIVLVTFSIQTALPQVHLLHPRYYPPPSSRSLTSFYCFFAAPAIPSLIDKGTSRFY